MAKLDSRYTIVMTKEEKQKLLELIFRHSELGETKAQTIIRVLENNK